MTRLRGAIGPIVLVVLWSGLFTSRTAAQETPRTLHVVWPASGGASELWARRVERRLEDDGLDATGEIDAWARAAETHELEARAAIARVERAIRDARAAMRELDERSALSLLAAAEERAGRALVLGGSVAWFAEIELAVATTAAQAGLGDLARAAFARALSLAPTRVLGAADAPPDVVQLAEDTARALRAAPLGRFEVTSETPRARLYLDDQLVGLLPLRVEARAGLHVLRVEAEGALPYATRVDVLPGARAPLTLALAPTRAVADAGAAYRASGHHDLDAIPPLVARLGEELDRPIVVWIVEAGLGPIERATAIACDASSCRAPSRLSTGSRESPATALDAASWTPTTERAALTWRDEPLPLEVVVPEVDVWSEAWPWGLVGGGAALVIGGVITGIVLATEPPPDRPLVFVIDPSPLAR
jgi:hypothetical protein